MLSNKKKMLIQKINNPNFNRLWNNKILLKSLEKISEHGTSFSAGISLAMALAVRPLAIMSTPNVEKENKQYACANSIASGLMKFAIVEAVALPVENAVKKIDKNPEKYLKPFTVKNLAHSSGKLAESKSYKLAAQILKLGTGFITAVPKSMLTIALIPIIMDKLFNFKPQKAEPAAPQKKSPTFTGRLTTELPHKLGKIFDLPKFQNFVIKHQNQEKDIAKHITAGTDILLTSSFAYQTSKSKNIQQDRKKALIYNNLISTAITITGGYGIDRIIKNKATKFIKKFAEINKSDPKLHKYIEGINIVRPALIFAGIYYGILPVFSTFAAEKIDKFLQKNN